LLGDKPITHGSSEAYPFESSWRVIEQVREVLSSYWPILAGKLPEKLTSRKSPPIQIWSSDSDGEYDNGVNTMSEDLESAIQSVIEPLVNLKVDDNHDKATSASMSWRSELSKIEIWYATFGSNMFKPRFRCYIEGGQVEGMRKACSGSRDKSPPKEILWQTVPHRLFFGHDHTATWGPGGVAFLNPEIDNQETTCMCLYRITLEQFNDVLFQENVLSGDATSPLFDLTALNSIPDKNNIDVELPKGGWYRNVLFLGKKNDIPILTMTCCLNDMESFKSGKFPLCPPAKEYADTLIRGLVEGKQFTEDEANAYIQKSSTKPL
jgi:histone deacetylase 6